MHLAIYYIFKKVKTNCNLGRGVQVKRPAALHAQHPADCRSVVLGRRSARDQPASRAGHARVSDPSFSVVGAAACLVVDAPLVLRFTSASCARENKITAASATSVSVSFTVLLRGKEKLADPCILLAERKKKTSTTGRDVPLILP